MMNRKQLEQLKQLRREIKSINRKLEQRKGRAQAQTDVVKGSLSEFPYTEAHFTIEGYSDPLSEMLKARARQLEQEVVDVENYIASVPDAEMRTILRYYYSIGLTLEEIGIELFCDKSTVKRKLDKFFEEGEKK